VVQYDVNCETVWSSSGIPATAALYGQAQLADQVKGVTFAAAKTSLDSESFLSFFATVDDPAHHSVVRGELDYAYMYAEFDISSVDVPDGYKASQWLSFIPLQDSQAKPSALQNTNPGALSAPIRCAPTRPCQASRNKQRRRECGSGQPRRPAFVGLWADL